MKVAGAYCKFTGLSLSHVSKQATGGGKVLDNIQAGSDMTTNRLVSTLQWFSDNWPSAAAWPEGIERPVVTGTQARKGVSSQNFTSVGASGADRGFLESKRTD